MDIRIIREYRKSLSISIDENGFLIVKAPFFLSSKKIEEFIKLKENWILKQKEKITNKKLFIKNFDFFNKVYINGNEYDWDKIEKSNKRITKASFYKKMFSQIILSRAEELKIYFNSNITFKLCNSVCMWGSCNAKNIIKLNWKIVILPKNLQDYIILHELCHTKHLNHSVKFWNEVEKFNKNYKQNKKELENYSLILREKVI